MNRHESACCQLAGQMLPGVAAQVVQGIQIGVKQIEKKGNYFDKG
ncbi:MAG TPA: hypothetical protein PKY50_12520 [Candidatus Competibacter sp.]|nr:hypothetical protein [Candidatus Competibacter sp.]